MGKGRFEGWYFKHQLGRDTVAFIPGASESGAFVQMLTPEGARYFPVPSLSVENGVIRAGACSFSMSGCRIDLPGVSGAVSYEGITPLGSDIMGLFRHLPMECRHGVLSMSHSLHGGVTIDGVVHRFDGGRGYIEKDSGVSFPSSYRWLQCNDFSVPCSVMLSIARIPFCALHFTGCICAILYGGREYRLATYKGVRIVSSDEKHVSLSQRSLRLIAEITPDNTGHALKSPVAGHMTGVIKESANAHLRLRLWEDGRAVFDLESPYAAYEYVRNT